MQCVGAEFVSLSGIDSVNEFTPSGVQSTFASGLNDPMGLAFDSAGDLFEGDYGSAAIFKFTPGGEQSTFASGLNVPIGLAFAVPEPSILGLVAVGMVAIIIRRLG